MRSLAGAIAIRDVGFGGFAVANQDERPHSYVHVAGNQRHHYYQRTARLEHPTPLWMCEEAVQPDRFGAAAES